MSNPTADWERVSDRFYRKIQLYSSLFDPDLQLENHFISGAPYSGALALHRKPDQLFSYRGGSTSKPTIDIYSCSGKLIERINWDRSPVCGLGWSEDEKLIVVAQDGSVHVYTDLSNDFSPFSLGQEAEQHGVTACRFWLTGFAALLGNNQLVSVTRYDEPRPKILATPPSDSVISWAVIPPPYTASRGVEVLLGIGQTINVVDASDSEDRMLQNGPFRHICVSPNGRFVALYTDDGKVWVISSDFQEKLSEYDSRVKTPPKDMQWCGNDAVVLVWDDEVHLVGPNGAAAKYDYDTWVYLVADVDGIKLFTQDTCEFLQKVPDVIEDVFKLGSTAPASVLLDAVDQLQKKSPKADEHIQMIKPNLVEAVDMCIDAAGHEFDHHWQKQLLKAASFGKSVLELYDSDRYVDMCETVRVLNAVRFYEVGLPLSYDQFIRLGPERLIRRLLNRREYLLALRLCEYLCIPTDQVYVHWARQKVRNSTEDDETICKRVVQKFEGKSGVSFEEIARAAHEESRQKLATELLNYEPRAGKQVPLLLDMHEDTVALDKAIESGDTDLVLYVLLHLKDKQKLPQASLFRTINTRPTATALIETTAREADRELLKDLYYQDDRRIDSCNLLFEDAVAAPDIPHTLEGLRTAVTILQDPKETTFHARAIDEYSRLLRLQEALDAEAPATSADDSTPTRYAGLSLHATIAALIRAGAHKRAQKAATDFKLPERAFWWLRLRALVARREWRALEDLAAQHRKSPIGWEPFFEEALAAGAPRVAGAFVAKCTTATPQQRVSMYVKAGMVVKAGEEALKAKDREGLEKLKGIATGRDVMEIERFLTQLGRA